MIQLELVRPPCKFDGETSRGKNRTLQPFTSNVTEKFLEMLVPDSIEIKFFLKMCFNPILSAEKQARCLGWLRISVCSKISNTHICR